MRELFGSSDLAAIVPARDPPMPPVILTTAPTATMATITAPTISNRRDLLEGEFKPDVESLGSVEDSDMSSSLSLRDRESSRETKKLFVF
jgi:hypothetical protein